MPIRYTSASIRGEQQARFAADQDAREQRKRVRQLEADVTALREALARVMAERDEAMRRLNDQLRKRAA